MEEQIDIKRLEQTAKALVLVGITTNVAILYAIEQTARRVQEKGNQFSMKDAEEINAEMIAKFPAEPKK